MRIPFKAIIVLSLLLAGCDSAEDGQSGSPPAGDNPKLEATAVVPEPAAVDATRIIHADDEPQNWLSYGRTYSEQRFSPLDQINAENVGELGLAWYFDFPTDRGIESTPIVVDGVMYVTASWSRVFALNAETGALLWQYDPKVPGQWAVNLCCDVVNRGVAVWGGSVYFGTLDGRLIALDAKDGSPVWEVQTTPTDRPYSITGAPRVIKGKVIIGNGGAELGVRGFVSAYDAASGKLVWRFYTVPGDPSLPFEDPILKQAAETWKGGEWWKVGGGGTVWDAMAYDPELDLLYFGVGNGAPWNRQIRSPGGGDNWFLSSIVAVRPDTGEYVWHYQTTPGETWDYTATQHMILADLIIDRKQRKVIMQAPKNGFFYVLDRESGELISAEKYTKATWASRVDPATGRPVENPEARYTDGKPVLVWPHALGGHNWHPMSYSPRTGLVYIPAQEIPLTYSDDEGFEYVPGAWNTGVKFELAGLPDDTSVREEFAQLVKGHISARDPVAQREVWRVQHPNIWNGGLLSTAGNLLFQGNAEAEFVAYRSDTGERLWSAPAQTGIVAGPISYAVNNKQYIAVAAGWGGAFALTGGEMASRSAGAVNHSRVLAYKLGGKTRLPQAELVARAAPESTVQVASAETITEGHRLYMRFCHVCHGDRAVSGSSLPDLRYMNAETRSLFKPIVLGGLRHEQGMVGFTGKIDDQDVDAIYAYLLKRANDAREGLD
jgi:PQQ-dependent dehydrogenase (methanol/ethanol family)